MAAEGGGYRVVEVDHADRRRSRRPCAARRCLTAMPELPEVETVARRLQARLPGAEILGAEVLWPRTITFPQPPERFSLEVAGGVVDRVGRRAKSVVLYLDDGRVLTVALRMTGALIVAAPGAPPDPHARVVFDAGRRPAAPVPRRAEVRADRPLPGSRPASGGRRLRPAMGRSRWPRRSPPPGWPTRLRRRSARLKTLLLDQSFIAGVGNIYADEALWRARLHPLRGGGHPDRAGDPAPPPRHPGGAARGPGRRGSVVPRLRGPRR